MMVQIQQEKWIKHRSDGSKSFDLGAKSINIHDISMFFLSNIIDQKMDFFCYEFMCVDMTVQALLTIMYMFYMCQTMLFGMCGAHSVENNVQSVPK